MALTEALVALAVAAMTMLLLSSAGWGLRMANERRAEAAAPAAAEWLATRRVMRDWAAGLTMARDGEAGQRIVGSETELRLVLGAQAAGLSSGAVVEMRIEDDDGVRRLTVTRHPGQGDARTVGDGERVTELMRTDAPLRFAYLVADEGVGRRPVWRGETHPKDLPRAIAVLEGDAPRVVAPVLTERSLACVAAVGVGGMEEPRCQLR